MKIMVASNLHGNVSEGLISRSNTFDGPVVFLGDVVGTSLLDQLQEIFYDGLYHPIKKLFQTNKNPSLREITLFKNEKNQLLYDSYRTMELLLNQFGQFQFDSFSQFVRKIAHYDHFGHFVGNLSVEIRQALVKDLEADAQKMINLMTSFTRRNSVFVVGGNSHTPLDFSSTGQLLPINQRSFYFKDFLLEHNPKIHYFDVATKVKFKEHLFVFWPFDYTTSLSPVFETNQEVEGKIVLFSCGDWQSIKDNPPF